MQRILIRATEELPTKYAGQMAWLQQEGFLGHADFHKVLTLDGNTVIFHESQIEKISNFTPVPTRQ